MTRKIIALLLCMLLCVSVALCESDTPAYQLPIDFSAGAKPLASGFSADGLSYEDPTLSIQITEGRTFECNWWVADIKVADASQLRTASAGGFTSSATTKGSSLAKKMNAVLAIAGDYYCYTGEGLIIRQGTLVKDKLQKDRDVLTVDANGDFHVYFLPDQGEVPAEVDGVPVINAFYFGPVLVHEGQMVENVNVNKITNQDMVANENRQRVAICQVGPLEYKIVCSAGPYSGSRGMTLQQFAEVVAAQGVQTAYNMDGGDSAMLLFNGSKVNTKGSRSSRKIVDIIYFASAWTGEE